MAISSNFASSLAGLNPVDAEDLQFLVYSNADIKKLSVAKITSIHSFDSMGNANKGGLYDPALGPMRNKNDYCGTCQNTLLHCPGHFGHIELPLVVMNPIFIKTIYTLFRISCLKCFKIQMDEQSKIVLQLQLDLLEAGHVTAALDLENVFGDNLAGRSKGLFEECADESPKKSHKILKKYKKILKNQDPIIHKFHNKNVSVLRQRFINKMFKSVNTTKACKFCQVRMVKINITDNKLMCNVINDTYKGTKILMADEIQNYCTKIAENDKDTLLHCFPMLQHVKVHPVTEIFFMNVVAVPPSNVRPVMITSQRMSEHLQTGNYKTILRTCFAARAILHVISSSDPEKAINALDTEPRLTYNEIRGSTPAEKLHYVWQELQKNINNTVDFKSANDLGRGLKQIIEKKTGIIRMNMMGKRVNFAARSVITPDPNVDIDEIGIPDAFATKLTYPVPVSEWNVEELRQMVINGPNKHPGAEKLEIENGRTILIPPDSIQKRKSLAKRLLTPDEFKSSGLKIVHRHVLNGDILIINRQPSLHKPSMMAHRARILKGEKTLRLHYANCKSYNADFDGDEMNAHLPQNEIARSEAYNIMSVRKQYLVPKDGTPLSGLIQDHVISGVKMSLRGSFYNKADYQQLVYQALSNRKGEIKLLPPTILKPRVLWSGKQVLSTIIINSIPEKKPYLSLTGKAKISDKAWQKEPSRTWKAGGTYFSDGNTMSEGEVIIRNGELLSGVLDKTHYGATPYGLVHCMFELYGGDSSTALLSSFSKVFTFYLQWIGFTLGVKDIIVLEDADRKRDKFIHIIRNSGHIAASKATDLPLDASESQFKRKIGEMMVKDPKFRANLDRQYKSLLDSYTNNINAACLGKGLLAHFPDNNLQLMVQSGAKGSTVNTMQISCLLGQIELEGKRPPFMISGKTLPSFATYDTTPRAGGFIDGRFLTGIQPQEFFFHCMAGREGLIDTAVKTSRSGYLQRCLIKHLEGLSIAYDQTVRDSDGSVIQFAYGEDGLDVLKCQFLKPSLFPFLDSNINILFSKSVIKSLKENTDTKKIEKAKKSIAKWAKRNPDNKKTSAFAQFSQIAKGDVVLNDNTYVTRDPYYYDLESKWRELSDEERNEYYKMKHAESIINKYSPNYQLGVISDQLNSLINNYLKTREINESVKQTDKTLFKDVMNAKYLESLAAPGEPVGLLAAQSIGEPSTQMTLNTFHFAGRGDMNVTLGIPRLREILMTASANLKTPSMDIPFHQDISNLNHKAEKLRVKLNRVTVADVLEKIDVNCEIVTDPERQLKTVLHFQFLPHDQYKNQYSVKPKHILYHMKAKFFTEMFKTIQKFAKASTGVAWTAEKASKKKQAQNDDDEEEVEKPKPVADDSSDDDDDEPNDDDDNTNVKIRKKREEEQEYDDPESDEEEKSEDEENEGDDEDVNKDDENEDVRNKQADAEKLDQEEIRELASKFHNLTHYTCNRRSYESCTLTILFPISYLRVDLSQALKTAATKSVIYEVNNIKRAITLPINNHLYIKTDGINIVEMSKYYQLLDINRLYSNDIHAVANTYGIEAAARVIIKEIQSVFNVYGIEVDPRHLSLISDYMTFNGKFEPMSRKGMEASASPLQQMSFESSLVFLKQAVLNAKIDALTSTSSSLMVGQPCKTGTGAFSLQHKTEIF